MQSRGGLVVSVSAYEVTDPGSILRVAIFPGSGVADSQRSESRGGYRSAIKMPAVKSCCNFTNFTLMGAVKQTLVTANPNKYRGIRNRRRMFSVCHIIL